MTISTTDQKKLWGKSGGICAICKSSLIEKKLEGNTKDFLIGEMAHIFGEKDGSARFNPGMTDLERNSENNLILLCPTDHTKIDKNEQEYTVEKLTKIKKDHEKWLQDAMREEMPNLTFSELDVAINYLITIDGSKEGESIQFIKPREKILRNALSAETENLITIGMSRIKEVKDYLNRNPDVYFAERLKNGLVLKYNELTEQGNDANLVFSELLKYSSGNYRDIKIQAAALVIIVYFFEACDIFEK